jgi:hypothetical protein
VNTEASSAPQLLVHAFAREHRRRLPGLLSALVMTGSATLDDWRPGMSDVDLVLITTRPVSPGDLVTIAELHAATRSGTPIDGVYLTESQLAAGPDTIRAAPQVVAGELTASQRGGELTWVTWREIENGVEATVSDDGAPRWERCTRRFPEASEGARVFSRRNLVEYWAPLGSQAREQLAGRSDADTVDASTVRWIALGPARLVVTVESGAIVSKTEAARFAARRWPAFHDLLSRAAASRAGTDVHFSVADARLAIALLERCVSLATESGR